MTATASGAQPEPQPREPDPEPAPRPSEGRGAPEHRGNPRHSVDRDATERHSVDRNRDDGSRDPRERRGRRDGSDLKVGSLDEVLRSAGAVVDEARDAYWSTSDDALGAPLSESELGDERDGHAETGYAEDVGYAVDERDPNASPAELDEGEPVSPGQRALLTPFYMGLRGFFSLFSAAVVMGTFVAVFDDLRGVTYSLDQDPLRTLWWLLFFVVTAWVWRRVAKRGPIQAIRDERSLEADVDARIEGLRDWLHSGLRFTAAGLVSFVYLFVPSLLVEVLGGAANAFFYDRLFGLTMVAAFFIAWKRSGRWAWVRRWREVSEPEAS